MMKFVTPRDREFSFTFKDLDRHVILQIDEVHIHSDASYKGGRIICYNQGW